MSQISESNSEPGLEPASEVDEPPILRNRTIDTGGRTMRQHAARGVAINSAFQVGLAGLGLLRRLVVAAFLTQTEYGLWGILIATLITLSWLKQIGISDKYIQQSDNDQEVAFQKAFTLELIVSLLFFAFVVAALPLYASAYDHPELIVPGIILAASAPISAFETPIWIAYRHMQFVRQRVLLSIDPVIALAVTIVLGALGYGYWALVVGAVAGSVLGALAATITCPYRLRLRFDRGTVAEYTKFSWPLVALGVTNMITIQGTLLIANRTVGLVGVGSIGLASAIASFADRVDGIVSQTIYPAVCAVADRTKLLQEAFVKSNRVILMWSMPFAVGLALFADDLVTFVLGERWSSAVGLLTAVALIVGVTQIAFNWSIFMRAVNNTKPLFYASLLSLVIFAVVMVPAFLAWGLTGYAVGLAATVVGQLILRGYYLSKLFEGFGILRHSIRAIAPSVPAAGIVLLLRLLIDLDRTVVLALGELVLYVGTTIVFTILFERRLVAEMLSYARGSVGRPRLASGQSAPQGA